MLPTRLIHRTDRRRTRSGPSQLLGNFRDKNDEQNLLLVPLENKMSETNNTPAPSFFDRLLSNDAARKGLATAVAGVVIAAVTELVWPSN